MSALMNPALWVSLLILVGLAFWLIRHYRLKDHWRKVSPLSYVVLVITALLSAFPFYWMYVVASNGNEAISKNPPATGSSL